MVVFFQPNNDISAYTHERTLIMEQRNEMLRKMRLSERQKRGDIQHILSRSFSQRGFSVPLSPPADISIPVPQFPVPPTVTEEPIPADKDTVSIGELSIEPRVAGSFATALNAPSDDNNSEKPKPGTVLVQLEDIDLGTTTKVTAGPESSSGEESCSEEKAVRTPLLDQNVPDAGGLPRMTQPGIHSYDTMFEGEEVPISGGGGLSVPDPSKSTGGLTQ